MPSSLERNYLINNSVIKKILSFLYSDFYFLLLIVYSAIFWYIDKYVIAISIMLLFASIILILQRDIAPVLPIIFMASATIYRTTIPDNLPKLLLVLIPIVLAIIFHIIYYPPTKLNIGRLTIPLLVVTIVCMLGGIFYPKELGLQQFFGKNILSALWIGIMPLVIYLITINFATQDNIKGTLNVYVAKTFLYFSLLTAIEIVLYYVKLKNGDFVPSTAVPHIGWTISNGAGTVILIGFPMGFYLSTQYKGCRADFYVVIATLELIAIFLTTSRGSTLFGLLVFAICLVFNFFAKEKGIERIRYLFLLGIMAVIIILLCNIYSEKIIRLFKSIIFGDGLDDNGRYPLYQEAIQKFKDNPLFGAGLCFIGEHNAIDEKGMYMFHNTIFQILGCLGIVGVIGYVYYYFERIKMIFEKRDLFNIYVFICMIGFEGYSLLNPGSFQGFPLISISIIMAAAIEKLNKLEFKPYLIGLKKRGTNVEK